jgi:hypothetical protein
VPFSGGLGVKKKSVRGSGGYTPDKGISLRPIGGSPRADRRARCQLAYPTTQRRQGVAEAARWGFHCGREGHWGLPGPFLRAAPEPFLTDFGVRGHLARLGARLAQPPDRPRAAPAPRRGAAGVCRGHFVARGRGPWASRGPRDVTLMSPDVTPGLASPARRHFKDGGRTRERCGPARRQRANPAPRRREGVDEGVAEIPLSGVYPPVSYYSSRVYYRDKILKKRGKFLSFSSLIVITRCYWYSCPVCLSCPSPFRFHHVA